MNTPGWSDGEIGIWIRRSAQSGWESWHDCRDLDIRGASTNTIDSIRLGGTRSGYPYRGLKYIDDMIVATTESEVER